MTVDPSGDTVSASAGETDDADPSRSVMRGGARVGRYRLVRELGAGGMGVVWAAHDPDLDREIALKVLRGGDDAGATARLLREARAMAKLKHPNVLTVYEVGTSGDRAYIAMELVDGDNLATWLARRPSRRDVVAALRAAGRGLAAAHAAGIIHRDFKPHNVLRSRDGRVLVTDFGLARTAGEPRGDVEPPHASAVASALDATLDAPTLPRSSSGSDALTRTGALVGTPAYMSPEQFAGGAPDPRTDQFAFCVTAWQAIGGARPYAGDSVEELEIAVKKGVLSTPAALPRRVRAALARGLDPDPAKRWRDLDELLGAFDRATRSRAPIAIAVAIAVAAIAGGVAFALTRGDRGSPYAECNDAEAAFAGAWNAARAQKLNAKDIAGAFDNARRDWLAALQRTCTDPAGASAQIRDRLDCLLDARDHIAAEATMLEKLAAASLHPFDASVLPHPSACQSKRASTPRPPAELASDIMQLRVGLARFRQLGRDEEAAHKLIDRAKRIGWAPMTVEIDVAAARRAMIAGDATAARADFRDAEAVADTAGLRASVVVARLGLAELALRALDDPRDSGEATRALDAAAATALPDDQDAAHEIEALRAWLAAGAGAADAAIPKLDEARRWFVDHGDPRRAVRIARQQAELLRRRSGTGDVEAAERVLRSTLTKLDEQHHNDDARGLLGPLADTLWRRGDLVALHDLDRRARTAPAKNGEHRTGRVVDERGVPVARATVVAWHGELAGDRERVYSEARFLPHDAFATTDDRGEFAIVVPGANAGIVAELGAARSAPQLVPAGDAPLELVVKPTDRRVDTVAAHDVAPSRLSIGARFEVGPNAAWTVRATLDDRGGFELERVPRAPAALWIDGEVGALDLTARRRVAFEHGRPAWRGRSFDVIVRGAKATQVHVWLLRGRVDPPSSITALHAELVRSGDHVEAIARSIGAVDATTFARASYERGDLHAAFFGPADEAVTACASQAVVDPAPHIWCIAATGTGDQVIVIDAR